MLSMALAAINGVYGYSQGQTLACSLWEFGIQWIVLGILLQKGFAYLAKNSQRERSVMPALTGRRFYANAAWLLVMWLPYIVLCFPGNIMGDTGDAILHGLGILPNDNNPFFLNWVYALVYRFGAHFGNAHIGVAIYCLGQVAAYIAVLAFSIQLAGEAGAPKGVRVFLLLLYGLIPVFPASAFCMSKDSIFTLFLFALCILLYVQRRFEWFYTRPVWTLLLLAVSALLPLMRNGAVYLTALCLLAAMMNCKKRQGKALLLGAVALSLIAGIALPRAANIPQPSKGEALSLPLQQTAYYMNHYEATEKEKEALRQVIDLKAFEQYDAGIVDPVKNQFRYDADMKDVFRYLTVWGKQFVKHPAAYVKAFYLHTNGYYTPAVLRNDLKPHVYLGYYVRNNVFGATKLKPNQNPGIALVREIDEAVTDLPVLGLLQRIGIYTWLLLAAIAYALYSGNKESLLDYLPLVLVFAVCCLSPVNAYIRYAFPLMLITPCLCGMNIFQKQPKQEASSK